MSRLHKIAFASHRWMALRRRVFERDGYRCCKCGKAGRLECDHVRPLKASGDPYDLSNLQALCRTCHIQKTRLENQRVKTPAAKRWQALVEELTF